MEYVSLCSGVGIFIALLTGFPKTIVVTLFEPMLDKIHAMHERFMQQALSDVLPNHNYN
jgi:hypothetical protein